MSARRAVRAAALVAAIAMLALAAPALGHAQFVSSTPRPNDILPHPPAEVTVLLSETVDPSSARIRVTNSTGATFEANGTHINPADAREFGTDVAAVGPCVYTVAWSAVSAVDGHYSTGSFAFAVQNPDGSLCGQLPDIPEPAAAPVSPVEVVLRFAAFATLAMMVGAVGLAALALHPARASLEGNSLARSTDALRLLALWATGQGLAFGAFSGAWAAYAVLSSPGGLSSSFLSSLAIRSALGCVVGALMAALPRLSHGLEDVGRTRGTLFAALAACAASVAVASSSSHAAAAVAWKPLGALFDFMHLGAAMFWVGALVSLVVLRGPIRASPRFARGVLLRFSRLAFAAVGAVLLGGLLLAVVQLGDVGALFASTYGSLVLAKALLFIPLAALGAFNHYRLIPALKQAKETADAALAVILRNVRVETALGLVVIVVAASLTAIAPAAPAPSPSGPHTVEARSADLIIEMAVTPDPGPVGVYTLEFQLYNASSGLPDNSTTNATMRVRLVNSTLPEQTIVLSGPHANHYFTDPPQSFGQGGSWRLDVDFLRPGRADLSVTYYVTIAPGGPP